MSDSTVAQVSSRTHLVTGELRPTLFLLALPVLFEQFLSFCVGFYDTYLSGQISAQATAAIGMAAYVGWLASLMFGLVGTGTTALVARSCGAGDFALAGRVMNRSLSLAALLGLAAYAVIFSAAPLLTSLLDMPDETRAIVIRYLRIDGFGHIFTSLTLVGAAALRGAGDMRTPMLILGLVSVLNVIASRTLVYGFGPVPPLGIDGIVGGTIIARVCGGLLMLACLARGIDGLKLSRRELRLRDEVVRRILRIGGPAAIDGLLMWSGQFLFLILIARLAEGSLGTATFAAHVVGIEIEAITYLPAVAWGYAASTMTGQALGARNPERAARVGHEAVWQCSLLAAVIALVFFFGAERIYALMHEDPAVRAIGAPAMRLLALFQVPLVASIIYVFALRGAGDTRSPMWITLFGVYFVRLPVGYLCGHVLDGGLVGAWIGMGGRRGCTCLAGQRAVRPRPVAGDAGVNRQAPARVLLAGNRPWNGNGTKLWIRELPVPSPPSGMVIPDL